MNAAVRVVFVLLVVAAVAAILLTIIRPSRAQDKEALVIAKTNAQELRLIRQLSEPDLTASEVETTLPSTDYARALQGGVVKVLWSREDMRSRLTSGFDLLERYPPDGVPGRHLSDYLDQNRRWETTVLRSVNERIRAIKSLQGDVNAFFLSRPEIAADREAAFSEGIRVALDRLRPAARLIGGLTQARSALARKPDTFTRAEYSRARAEFDAWQRAI